MFPVYSVTDVPGCSVASSNGSVPASQRWSHASNDSRRIEASGRFPVREAVAEPVERADTCAVVGPPRYRIDARDAGDRRGRQDPLDVLRRLATQFDGRVRTIFSTRAAIADLVTKADLVIGAVLVPGASAPKLITRTMLKTMKQGSVFVDIAIDQGGCAETSRPTTHSNPTFVVDGVVHYCVANMPGAVARTSTFALNNATMPFTLQLADKGWRQALKDDIHLRNGLNVCDGKITCKPVADAHGLAYTPAEALID